MASIKTYMLTNRRIRRPKHEYIWLTPSDIWQRCQKQTPQERCPVKTRCSHMGEWNHSHNYHLLNKNKNKKTNSKSIKDLNVRSPPTSPYPAHTSVEASCSTGGQTSILIHQKTHQHREPEDPWLKQKLLAARNSASNSDRNSPAPQATPTWRPEWK